MTSEKDLAGSTLSLPFLRYSTGNNKSGITTETNIITLKNLATNVLGGTNTNRHPIQSDYVAIAADSAAASDPCVVRAVLNTTLGGTPSYASFSSATSVV